MDKQWGKIQAFRFLRFKSSKKKQILDYGTVTKFRKDQGHWLEDYALFISLKESFGGKCWLDWPSEYRDARLAKSTELSSDVKSSADAHVFFQYIFDEYPLWLCGCLNNHLNYGIVAYCLVILGISKLFLLFRPMDYHSANHERIVKYILISLAIFVMCDNLLYFVFSNKYYCHSGTILRVAAIYNRSVNVTIIKGQSVHAMFVIWDFGIFMNIFY